MLETEAGEVQIPKSPSKAPKNNHCVPVCPLCLEYFLSACLGLK